MSLGNMREAWWMPMIELPTDIVPTGQQLLTDPKVIELYLGTLGAEE